MKKDRYMAGMLCLMLTAGLSAPALAEETLPAEPETQTVTEAAPQTEAPVTEAPAQSNPQEEVQDTPSEGELLIVESESEQASVPNGPITQDPAESGDTDVSDEENQAAFDLIIIEDENGTMEQEPTEAESETSSEFENAGESEKKEGEEILFTLEKEQVTRWGESLSEFTAYPVGDLSQNQAKIYRYLRDELKLNKAAASGILANMESESAFSTVAVGDSGTSYGLCQWHAGRFSSLVAWCKENGYNYHLLDGQLAYMTWELNNGYGNVFSYLQKVPDTAGGAYQAGYCWCMYYESPNDTVNRAVYRGKVAMHNYFPSDLDAMEDEAKKEFQGRLIGGRALFLLNGLLDLCDEEDPLSVATEFWLHINLIEDVDASVLLEDDFV